MAIHIDVMADLHKRSVEKVANDIQARFDKVGFEVHPDLNKREVEAVAQYLERRLGDITAEVKVDVDHSGLATATRSMDRARKSTGGLTKDIQDLGRTAFLTSRGLATMAVPIAAIVAIDFGKWAVQATGSLGLLPAVASAAAAGIGTLNIATAGFGDTIKDMGDPKKFAEGLAMLSPNAQQAALEIKALVDGPLGDLKRATQDAFFANWAQQLDNLTRTLGPSLEKMTTSISTSFNQMFMGITDQMMTPQGAAQIQTIFDNLGQTFQNLVPAAQSFSQAFMDITEVGSGFLPGIADSVSSLAQNFADFIREAKESGKLGEWIQNGIDAVAMLADQLFIISGQVMQLFGSGGDGQASIESFKDDLESISDVLRLMNGDFSEVGNELTLQFNRWGEDLKGNMVGAINHVSKVINTWLDGMAQIPILGGAVPDFRLPEVTTGDWQGGGGAFGAPPGGQGPRGGGVGNVPQTDWRNRAGPSRGGFPQRPVPGVPPEGGAGSDKDRRDAIIAGLDPALWQVDPFGGMAGMQMGPGADPQDVLEQQRNVISEAHDLEEATKNLLALQRDNTATAQDIDEAKWKEVEEGWQLQEAQVKLAEKMAGTAKDVKSGADELSAALDPDLGLGKGLAGLADNLVRFLGHMALAPIMAKGQQAINQQEAATGIKGGYGMFGIMGAQNMAQGLSPLLGRPMPGAGPASSGGGYQSSYNPTGGMYPSATAASTALPTTTNGAVPTARPGGGSSGLQSNTARGKEIIQRLFPWATNIGGVRSDPKKWHPQGLALDVMIPGAGGLNDPTPAAGKAQGDQLNAFLQANAEALGIDYTMWQEKDHFNHIHANFAESGFGPPGPMPPLGGMRTSGGGIPAPLGQLGKQSGPLPFTGGGGQSPILSTYGAGRGASPDQPGWTGPTPHGGGGMPGPATQIGAAVEPYANPGGGGAGIAQGGPIDTAIQGAAAAADLFAPGSGQAIQMGMKLANRAIQYGGQMAGIGVSGLLETFLPTGGSELANNNWLTRIAGGFAGASPQIPNLAGKGSEQGPLTPQQVASVQGDPNLAGFENKPGVVVNYQNNGATEDRAGADLAFHLGQVNSSTPVTGAR